MIDQCISKLFATILFKWSISQLTYILQLWKPVTSSANAKWQSNLFVFYNNIERFYGEILYMCCDTYGTYKTIFSSTVENIVSGSLALE